MWPVEIKSVAFLIKETKVNNPGQIVKTATTNEQSHYVFQTTMGMFLSAKLAICPDI